MKARHAAWEAIKSLVLTVFYFFKGDWKYDPAKKRYWPSGRRG